MKQIYKKNSNIDENFSGLIYVMVMQIAEKLLCANLGDSRGIMVKDNNQIIKLSIVQKPDDSKRIIKSEDEITQRRRQEKSGPFRVWKKREAYPGIAMSRNIEDFITMILCIFL